MFSPAALALRITSSVTKHVVAMPVTSVSGAAGLERVAIGGVAPGRAEVLLDAIDDLAGLHRAGLQ